MKKIGIAVFKYFSFNLGCRKKNDNTRYIWDFKGRFDPEDHARTFHAVFYTDSKNSQGNESVNR